MKSSTIVTAAAILMTIPALSSSGRAQEKTDARADKQSRFEQFKALEGEWTGKGGEGDTKVVYHVTSGGSAVTETISPGTGHEMVTIITKDGADLALTHYCVMGNQPHMKAPGSGTGNSVAFKFTSGGNMKSDQEAHMHSVTYTFVDKDTLKSEWTMYDKGKPTSVMPFLLSRNKK